MHVVLLYCMCICFALKTWWCISRGQFSARYLATPLHCWDSKSEILFVHVAKIPSKAFSDGICMESTISVPLISDKSRKQLPRRNAEQFLFEWASLFPMYCVGSLTGWIRKVSPTDLGAFSLTRQLTLDTPKNKKKTKNSLSGLFYYIMTTRITSFTAPGHGGWGLLRAVFRSQQGQCNNQLDFLTR